MIEQAQQQIRKCRRQVPQACTIRQLFLLEAASARTYWRIVRIMCHQHEGWHRIHPQADDALNRLLNVGYTILARRCREALLKTHLMPQLGILHGSHAVEPLVYDMAEIFRQPVVDAVLLPIFSRKQKEVYRLPRTDARRAFQNLYQRYHQRVLYFGMCEPLDRVIAREAVRLRRALVDDAVWIPYAYPWRHGAKCRKAKKKPA
jgi:CRISPR-associated endonuclease Cas1